MLHVPAIIVYKMNAITTWIGKMLINIKWVSLVNILLKRGVYPEFLGPNATAENILDAVQQLTIPANRDKMTKDLQSADNMWRREDGGASKLIAQGILQAI